MSVCGQDKAGDEPQRRFGSECPENQVYVRSRREVVSSKPVKEGERNSRSERREHVRKSEEINVDKKVQETADMRVRVLAFYPIERAEPRPGSGSKG